MPDGTPEIRQWLAEEWAGHFARSIEAVAEEKPAVAIEPPAPDPDEPSGDPAILWWRQEFSFASGAACWFGARNESWDVVGRRILKAAGVAEEDPEGVRATYLEILQQSLSSLAQSLSVRLETEITCSGGSEAAPDCDSSERLLARFAFGDAECRIVALFPAAFVSAVTGGLASRSSDPALTTPQSALTVAGKSVSMDLLLDVELPVSVSFGRAELPLKDVLKLTTGSIIELNRSVSEPVEIIVNNCVIARGEVVVVEGNFGVRIRQVISRQERMRTLK